VVDDTQVYITGVLYQQDAYPSDPSSLFSLIDQAFRQISGLEYWELLINRSECRFSNSTTREQLLLFMKDVKYNGTTFLSDIQSSNMRTAIINKLNELSDITYNDVEIRTTRQI
jgi:anti-anti-sigma regulatory factor